MSEIENQNVVAGLEQAENTPAQIVQPPVKTGKDKAMGTIATILSLLGFLVAVAGLITITTLVVIYNFNYTLEPLYGQAEINEMLATAAAYKGYAKIIIYCCLFSLACGLTALVLAKIQTKKGFNCKIAKIFGLITIIVSGVAILNCVVNLFLFGRYKTIYM